MTSEALTDAEWAEVNRSSLGTLQEFTEQEFAERLRIAKKWCKWVQTHPMAGNTEEFLRIYQQYPLWGFYLVGNLPKRVFGIASSVETVRLKTISALPGFNNITIGGTEVTRLERVDRWPDEIVQRLKSGLVQLPGIFLDPLGFMYPMHIHHQQCG